MARPFDLLCFGEDWYKASFSSSRQIALRMRAASLNYRDLLTVQGQEHRSSLAARARGATGGRGIGGSAAAGGVAWSGW